MKNEEEIKVGDKVRITNASSVMKACGAHLGMEGTVVKTGAGFTNNGIVVEATGLRTPMWGNGRACFRPECVEKI